MQQGNPVYKFIVFANASLHQARAAALRMLILVGTECITVGHVIHITISFTANAILLRWNDI